MDKLESLFVWGECQDCRLVVEGWNPWDEARSPCPNCGSRSGLPWPGGPAELLLDKAFAQNPEDYEDMATMGMLVTIALESMTEFLLASAIESVGGCTPDNHRIMDAVLDSDLGVERRLKMIKAITGVDYRTVSRGLGERSFAADWERLRQRRNQFVHRGESCAFEPKSELELLSLSRAAIKVFAEVNNLMWGHNGWSPAH